MCGTCAGCYCCWFIPSSQGGSIYYDPGLIISTKCRRDPSVRRPCTCFGVSFCPGLSCTRSGTTFQAGPQHYGCVPSVITCARLIFNSSLSRFCDYVDCSYTCRTPCSRLGTARSNSLRLFVATYSTTFSSCHTSACWDSEAEGPYGWHHPLRHAHNGHPIQSARSSL
jgi:hypothetical protein